MKPKSIARICGGLYIVTVLTFLVSNLVLKAQLVDAEDIPGTFHHIADHAARYRLAVSIDFLAMVGVMALAFSLYLLLKPVNPYLALLALGVFSGKSSAPISGRCFSWISFRTFRPMRVC